MPVEHVLYTTRDIVYAFTSGAGIVATVTLVISKVMNGKKLPQAVFDTYTDALHTRLGAIEGQLSTIFNLINKGKK